jgi:hypothetical protein
VLTEAEFDVLYARVDRRNHWGSDDQNGALNFITPSVRAAALAGITGDTVISCARLIRADPGSKAPVRLTRSIDAIPGQHWSAVNEQLAVQGHGRDGTTHLDALAHFAWKGHAHNKREQVPALGGAMLDVQAAARGVLTRGFLVDLRAATGDSRLRPGAPCSLLLLRQILDHTSVTPRSGDALVLRMNSADDGSIGGLALDCATWLHDQQVAIVITDAGFETEPSQVQNVLVPWHVLALTAMGIHLVDLADLGTLAETCARRRTWTFLLALAPPPITRSTSALINPLAIF